MDDISEIDGNIYKHFNESLDDASEMIDQAYDSLESIDMDLEDGTTLYGPVHTLCLLFSKLKGEEIDIPDSIKDFIPDKFLNPETIPSLEDIDEKELWDETSSSVTKFF